MRKLAAMSFLLAICFSVYGNFVLQNLRVNYEATPIGTDISQPQFSWQMNSMDQTRGYMQTAYQIIVVNEAGKTVWDSGKKPGAVAHGILYQGENLKSATRYVWTVTAWDNHGQSAKAQSWFETGLMDTNIAAWSGAQWIGGSSEDMPLYSPYLSVYKLQCGVQLDKASGSTRASFVFGANDPRLMNKDLNIMAMANSKNKSYIALEIDISQLNEAGGTARLNIYRVGYTSEDKDDTPVKTLDIPSGIINFSNRYDKHTVHAYSNFGIFEFFVDGTDVAHKIKDPTAAPSRFGPAGLNLNPVGSGNNFISFPMVAEIGFMVSSGQKASFSDVVIRNFREPANVLFSENPSQSTIFRDKALTVKAGGYQLQGPAIVTADPSRNAAPMLRSVFTTSSKKVAKARLYATARGIYEIYLNGHRVSNDFFNPGLTQYNRHHMYQTYDVTSSIKANQANAIGAWLGEGWWSGNITYSGESWNYFGDRQSLLTKLVITYEDGSQQTVTSNDKDWKVFADGPIRYGSFFQGEVYDAGKEAKVTGWTTAAYNDKAWKKASSIPLEGTAFTKTTTDFNGRKTSLSYDQFQLVGQMGENPSIIDTLTALEVREARPGVFVYDMGQNMVGIPHVTLSNGKKGNVVTMRFAEVTYPNLPDYKGNEGMVMMENIRAALAQDLYVQNGGKEIIQPRFTFHGYRYVEITGLDKPLPVGDVKGLVISSVKELTAGYETSNKLVNKLWENITWSLRGNFLSIPTDCPNRNERMGWSGDIQVFSRSATYLTNSDMFLRRHLLAMRDIQFEDGRYTDVAPMGGGFGGTLWGSAGIVVAWETYRQYGDLPLLAEHYESMKRYMAFLETKVSKENGILNEGPLGDWLSPEGNKNDNTLFWMAYFAYDLELVSKSARELGFAEESKRYHDRAEEIKKAWNEIYVDKQSKKTIKSGVRTGFMGPPNERTGPAASEKGMVMDTQASYAIPLALGIFNEENKPFAIRHLRETIERTNTDDGGSQRPPYSLMTGFIGTASISEALSENGADDLAYKLIVQKEYPSWLYSVVNGATTIWERLNSYTVENGFGGNNSMNSFNHYSFGAVAAWMSGYSVGIQRDPGHAGFDEFVLKPTVDPTGSITFAKGHYESMYGRIESEWKVEGGLRTYVVSVPANTKATIYLPASSVNGVTESGQSIASWDGVKMEGGKVVVVLGSGRYTFVVR